VRYLQKCLRIYLWNILQWVNRHVLKTYPLNEECTRCEDCGRNVHDYHVPDELWMKIIGDSCKVFCFDCFVNRAREKGEFGITANVHLEAEAYP